MDLLRRLEIKRPRSLDTIQNNGEDSTHSGLMTLSQELDFDEIASAVFDKPKEKEVKGSPRLPETRRQKAMKQEQVEEKARTKQAMRNIKHALWVARNR